MQSGGMLCSASPELCLNGGTCVVNGSTEWCSCPAGFGPDLFAFHDDNCALPDGALRWIFLHFAALYAPLLALTAWVLFFNTKVKLQGHGLFAVFAGLAGTVGAFFLYLGVWLQGGSFEVYSVFILLAWLGPLTSIWFLAHICLKALTSTQHSDANRRLSRVLNVATVLMGVFFVGCAIGLIVTCRQSHAVYNVLNAVVAVAQGVVATLYNALVFHVMRKLEDILTEVAAGDQSNFFSKYARRVHITRWIIFFFLFIFALCTVVLGVLHFALGSMPYGWAIIVVRCARIASLTRAAQFEIDSTLGILLALLVFVEHDALTARSVVTQVTTAMQNSLRSLERGSSRRLEGLFASGGESPQKMSPVAKAAPHNPVAVTAFVLDAGE